MKGQNSKAAEPRKAKGWAWQDIVVAILAVACILFSTVIVARGVDTPSAAGHPRGAPARPAVHDAVMSALSAAADDIGWNKIREEARSLGNGLAHRVNVFSPPALGSIVANAERPLAAVFSPITRTLR